MNPYRQFVSELERLLCEARALPLGGAASPPSPPPRPRADAPLALVFSPHPDDEVIVGGLPLRLLREAGWRIVNVAVTHGSQRARRAARLAELKACCDYIGFELVEAAPDGLERVNLDTRAGDPQSWSRSVRRIAEILAQGPHAVFFPHAEDVNATHVGTHHLVVDALTSLGPSFGTRTVETEYWGPLRAPNLLLELAAGDVAMLVTALTFHVGEVRRNPYHLSLPAWMIDNVRRGSELVLGPGAAAPPFTFAMPYRVRLWEHGAFAPLLARGRALSVHDDVGAMFR